MTTRSVLDPEGKVWIVEEKYLGIPNNPGVIRPEMIHCTRRQEAADASGGIVRAIGAAQAVVGLSRWRRWGGW